MKKTVIILGILIIGCLNALNAQDIEDLMKENKPKEYVIATFKGTRAINFHTIEVPGPKTLEFRISHRFGTLNSGAYNLWGLDGGANIRFGLEYSIDGRFEFGLGRTSTDKVFDGFLKYKLFRQTTDNKMPFSLTLFSSMFYTTLKDPYTDGVAYYPYATSRMSFCNQLLIARKFGSRFSMELIPSMVHYNQVDQLEDKNDVYLLAGIGRFKVSRSTAITAEYGLRLNKYTNQEYYDSFGIGFDIETGGHVFQMVFTNSFGLIEPQFYPHTTDSWSKGGIRFGFNISRVFTL